MPLRLSMVGGFAAQLAAARGARVVAAVRDPDADEARRLGAEIAVNAEEDLEAVVRGKWQDGVDACLDAGATAELARDAAAGELTVRVAEILPLEYFRDADGRLERGGLHGKIVLTPYTPGAPRFSGSTGPRPLGT